MNDPPRPVLDYVTPPRPQRRPFSVWVMLQKLAVLALAAACLLGSAIALAYVLTGTGGPDAGPYFILAFGLLVMAAWLGILSLYLRPFCR